MQGYRNYRRPQGPGPHDYELLEDVKALKKKAGVYHIVEAQGATDRWYPEPYSEQTLQVRKSLEIWSASFIPSESEIMITLRRELPELFKCPPLRDIVDVARVTSVIHVTLGTPKRSNHKIHLRHGLIHKPYYYFPQPPQIENGHIVEASYSMRDQAYTRPGQRVRESLDEFPPAWKRGECVLKPIDEHWLIAICRGS